MSPFSFSFHMPTQVLHGFAIVRSEQAKLAALGRRAFVVTGRTSAKASGALDDCLDVFREQNIDYDVFDQVEPNPTLANLEAGATAARHFAPDFIVGIGGGSPLDAAKGIAVLAVNDVPAEALLTAAWTNDPLPIAAIPTTAGTGSEVTPYSVVTRVDKETKQGFGHPSLFPRFAFLDARYTESLPFAVTVDTAVDALSHLVEGYFTKKASEASDMLAQRGMELWSRCLPALQIGEAALDYDVRDRLLIASALGGMTIAHTGTAFVHSLGYPLTYYHDMPHGQANGLLLAGFLRHAESVEPDRAAEVLNFLGQSSVASLGAVLKSLFPTPFSLSQEQIDQYVTKTLPTKNVQSSPGTVTREVLLDALQENFSSS